MFFFSLAHECSDRDTCSACISLPVTINDEIGHMGTVFTEERLVH